jgi:hypothetical protein
MIDVGSAGMRLWLRRVAALLAVIVGGWIVGASALQASSMAMVHRGAPAVVPVPQYGASVELTASELPDAAGVAEPTPYASTTSPPSCRDSYDAGSSLRFGRGRSIGAAIATGEGTVHSVLSPSWEPLANARTWMYQNAHLARYLEEAAAETYGTGSLRTGLTFPVTSGGYDLSAGRMFGETALLGGVGYGGYRLYEDRP